MTPSGWTIDTVVAWGAAWMFGGMIASAALGTLVARRRGGTFGMGSGLLLWGLGNLLVALTAWVFVQFDSVVLTLTATRCEPSLSRQQQPMHTPYYAVQRPGEPAHEAVTGSRSGVCPESPMPVDALRLRKDALAGPDALVHGELADDDTPLAIIVTWSAFGVFALFGAGLLLAHGASSTARPKRLPGPLAPWRKGLGSLFGNLGLLLVLAALIVPHFLPGSTERSIAFGLRTGATALGSWIVAGLLARTMDWAGAAFLALFVLVMLGISELMRFG